jgi:hypothetical protein
MLKPVTLKPGHRHAPEVQRADSHGPGVNHPLRKGDLDAVLAQ